TGRQRRSLALPFPWAPRTDTHTHTHTYAHTCTHTRMFLCPFTVYIDTLYTHLLHSSSCTCACPDLVDIWVRGISDDLSHDHDHDHVPTAVMTTSLYNAEQGAIRLMEPGAVYF